MGGAKINGLTPRRQETPRRTSWFALRPLQLCAFARGFLSLAGRQLKWRSRFFTSWGKDLASREQWKVNVRRMLLVMIDGIYSRHLVRLMTRRLASVRIHSEKRKIALDLSTRILRLFANRLDFIARPPWVVIPRKTHFSTGPVFGGQVTLPRTSDRKSVRKPQIGAIIYLTNQT